MGEKYQALVRHLADVVNLGGASALLEWDMQVMMPQTGGGARAGQIATVSRLRHEIFTSDKTGELLEAAAAELAGADYDSDEVSLVRVVQQDYAQAQKLPASFVEQQAQITTEAHETWAKARAENDFQLFLPKLERIIEMVRQQAEYIGYTDHPYDALIGEYERGITTAEVKSIFDGHKAQLVELVAEVLEHADRVNDSVLHQPFDVEQQRAFAHWASETIGFDYSRGRQDVAVHPFATSIGSRYDVRLTTRFYPEFFNPAFFGSMHESGHGMYEQGVSPSIAGTHLGSGTSLGVHESQSRLWENIVGRSRGFWEFALPKLQAVFPSQFSGADVDTLYKAFNKVERGFIRVEADEATYNLHIMLRFELETELLKGTLQARDLSEAWNSRFESYFGVTPPSDTLGVLQDVHWSAGLIGYFPTYALGNLLSVQYYNKALEAHPEITEEITRGEFSTLLTWLQENIYQHGRKFTSAELTKRVTGGAMDSQPYLHYLQNKYRGIYGLNG